MHGRGMRVARAWPCSVRVDHGYRSRAVDSPLCRGTATLRTPARTLKTLDVREYRPLGTPIEFRFYQRYTNNPNNYAEVQFLTHYETYQRYRVKRDFIDYLNWGKEQGQARLPHRHQRVAFDFDDVLHPTRIDADNNRGAVALPMDALGDMHMNSGSSSHHHHGGDDINAMASRQRRHRQTWFRGQDPSLPLFATAARRDGDGDDLSFTFDPNRRLFSQPEHWNQMFSKRRPGEGDIRLGTLDSNSLLGPLLTQTDTQDMAYFHVETRGPTHGRVPGVNAPYVGEADRRLMHAMSRPLNATHTLTGHRGRFCRFVFLNDPRRHHALSATRARELDVELDKATNGVYTKLTVLEAAQSGQTDCFCAGLDLELLGFDLQRAAALRARAQSLLASNDNNDNHNNNDNSDNDSDDDNDNGDTHTTNDVLPSTPASRAARRAKAREAEAHSLLRDAVRHADRADHMLRAHAALVWRVYSAARPLMTLVNGKCYNTGCGVALAARYCALKDSSEFVCDGAEVGLTPYGGLTAWLARRETAHKYPGLAEFVLLTGTSLFAGDVLRLGWTDLFTTLPDTTYHIKEWFDASEHMHNDAVAWQLGQLLETCFKMSSGDGGSGSAQHSSVMERCAITPTRARWIEDAFADQPSVEAVVATLSRIEALPIDGRDVHNTRDVVPSTPFTLASVTDGVHTLARAQLRYTLAPWDVTPPTTTTSSRHDDDEQAAATMSDGSSDSDDADEAAAVRHAGELFTSYVLERHGNVDLVVHRDRAKLRRWREQREREYVAFTELKSAPHPRHVYARLEGCEGRVVDFELVFDFADECRHTRRAESNTSYTYNADRNNDNNNNDAAAAADGDADVVCTTMLTRLKQRVLQALHMPRDRAIELGWYLPTLDTCPVRTDAELRLVLHHDPGIEDARAPCRYPPVYFLVKRSELFLSEWAYAVKHQLLLQCPYALKATFALLQQVRRVCAPDNNNNNNNNNNDNNNSDNSNNNTTVAGGLHDALALEYQYLVRAARRADFYAVGQYTKRSSAWWHDVKAARTQHVHDAALSPRPLPSFDEDVFERDVALQGHRFRLRPRWQPRTLEEVRDDVVAALSRPLSYRDDEAAALDVRVYSAKATRLAGMIDDAGGLEVVAGLGSTRDDDSNNDNDNNDNDDNNTTSASRVAVAPLKSDAYVPRDVDFYAMARHPLDDVATSWRSDGYTPGSRAYYEQQYAAAQRAVYDEDGSGARQYWPSTAAVNGVSGDDAEALLEQRLQSGLARANSGVEPWARALRRHAMNGTLAYKTEIATQQEKIYDDEYYRWFVQPGHHPNASGMLPSYKGSRGGSSSGRGGVGAPDRDLDAFLQTLLAEPAAVRRRSGSGSSGDDGVTVDVDEYDVARAAGDGDDVSSDDDAEAAAMLLRGGSGGGGDDGSVADVGVAAVEDDTVMEPLLDGE